MKIFLMALAVFLGVLAGKPASATGFMCTDCELSEGIKRVIEQMVQIIRERSTSQATDNPVVDCAQFKTICAQATSHPEDARSTGIPAVDCGQDHLAEVLILCNALKATHSKGEQK